MKLVLLAFILAIAAASDESFKDWKVKHGKKYSSTSNGKTEADAEKTFKENVAKIAKHNSDPKATYKQEANANADMTPEEVRKAFKGKPGAIGEHSTQEKSGTPKLKSGGSTFTQNYDPTAAIAAGQLTGKLPKTLDYTSQMSPVKNQGTGCTANYVFGVVATIEYWSFKNGSNKIYSEQNLLDCDTSNKGCNGGNSWVTFRYAMTKGIVESSLYPYVGATQSCQPIASTPSYFLQNYCWVSLGGSETVMMQLLVKYGPLLTAINTVGTGFDSYKSGVFNSPACSSDPAKQDLVVVVVGYGTNKKDGDFWIVRNSWGTQWGEKGYIRMAKNKGNLCGIATFVTTPCPLPTS